MTVVVVAQLGSEGACFVAVAYYEMTTQTHAPVAAIAATVVAHAAAPVAASTPDVAAVAQSLSELFAAGSKTAPVPFLCPAQPLRNLHQPPPLPLQPPPRGRRQARLPACRS